MSRFFCKLHRDKNRVNVFAIHRCINEGYGLIRIFTEKIRISVTKLWRVCTLKVMNVDVVFVVKFGETIIFMFYSAYCIQ